MRSSASTNAGRRRTGIRASHPPTASPTAIHGGEWIVSHPAACRIECHLEFLPEQADAGGWGAAARREFEAAIRRAAEQDEWLLRHPPRVEWLLGGVPSAEVAEDEPIVRTLLGVHRDLTSDAQVGGFDNWSDAATLIREAGIPSVNYGPGDLRLAHTARRACPRRRTGRLRAGHRPDRDAVLRPREMTPVPETCCEIPPTRVVAAAARRYRFARVATADVGCSRAIASASIQRSRFG